MGIKERQMSHVVGYCRLFNAYDQAKSLEQIEKSANNPHLFPRLLPFTNQAGNH